MNGLLATILNRHKDGTHHRWVQTPLGDHYCDGHYCGHWRAKCSDCDKESVFGSGTLEVR